MSQLSSPLTPKSAASHKSTKIRPSPFKNVTTPTDNKLQIGIGSNSFSYSHSEHFARSPTVAKKPDLIPAENGKHKEHSQTPTNDEQPTQQETDNKVIPTAESNNSTNDVPTNTSHTTSIPIEEESRKKPIKTANPAKQRSISVKSSTHFVPSAVDIMEQHRLIHVTPQKIISQQTKPSKTNIPKKPSAPQPKQLQEKPPTTAPNVDNSTDTFVITSDSDLDDEEDADEELSDDESSDDEADDEGDENLYEKEEAEVYRYRIEPKRILKLDAQPPIQISDERSEFKRPKARTIYSSERNRHLRHTREMQRAAKSRAGQGDDIRDVSYMIESTLEEKNKKYVEKITRQNYKNSVRQSLKHWGDEPQEEQHISRPFDPSDITETFNEDIQTIRKLKLPNIGKKSAVPEKSRTSIGQMRQPPKTAAAAIIADDDFLVDEVLKAVGKKDLHIPQTQIPKEFHIVEHTPIVTKDDLARESQYNSDKGVWETRIFPSNKPTSRVEVMHLARTCETMMRAVKQQTDDEVARVKVNVEVMDIIGSEIARQVFVSCSERGILLQKVLGMMTKVNKTALEWHQDALGEIIKKQEQATELNNHIKALEKTIRDKEAEIAQKEKSILEMGNTNSALVDKLQVANKSIASLNTEYFSPRPVLEKRQYHHDVRDENPLGPIRITEEEVRKKFTHTTQTQTSIDFGDRSSTSLTLQSEETSDDELDFGVKVVMVEVGVQVIEDELDDEDDLKRYSNHMNLRRPNYYFSINTESENDGRPIPQHMKKIAQKMAAQNITINVGENSNMITIPNTSGGPDQKLVLDQHGVVTHIVTTLGKMIPIPTETTPSTPHYKRPEMLVAEVQTSRSFTLNKNPQTTLQGPVFSEELVNSLEDKIKTLEIRLSMQLQRSPSPVRGHSSDAETNGRNSNNDYSLNVPDVINDNGKRSPSRTSRSPSPQRPDSVQPPSSAKQVSVTVSKKGKKGKQEEEKQTHGSQLVSPRATTAKKESKSNKNREFKLRTLKNEEVYKMFHEILHKEKPLRLLSLRWLNRMILEIFTELTTSDFLSTTNDQDSLKKFVYDFHLVKFGLATIAVNHLGEFLYNTKHRYNESIRIQMFANFCNMAEWCGSQQGEQYNLVTLQFYLRTIHLTKVILNKRALHELEEGALYVSLSFANNLLERLRLPFSEEEMEGLVKMINDNTEDSFIFFDNLLSILVFAFNEHLKKRRPGAQEEPSPQPTPPSAGAPAAGATEKKKKTAISTSAFKRMMRTFFVNLYNVNNKSSSSTSFVTLNEQITRETILDVYAQTELDVNECISSIENEDRKQEVTTEYGTIQEFISDEMNSIPESLDKYKNFIAKLFAVMNNEKYRIFAMMINKLVP
jgi:hypothetical protein